MEGDRSRKKVERLLALLGEVRSLLILMQDNPDPDSIAAAAALRRLANTLGDVQCSIAYGGVIGRVENRAMASYLGLNFRSIEQVDPQKYDAIALVDTQPGTGNNSLPAGLVPRIVIDHHPLRPETRSAEFTDVRSRYGAVSTILFEYLEAAGVVPDAPLATALLYAIRTDTQDLAARAAPSDVRAVETLYPLANKKTLGAIQRGAVGASYFEALARALVGARLHGGSLISALGPIDSPDLPSEMADLLLRHEDVVWVLCHGEREGKLLLSLRTSQSETTAHDVAAAIVAGLGTGGGHGSSAGGQIPLARPSRTEREALARTIRDRFLEQTGAAGTRGVPLVRPPARRPA